LNNWQLMTNERETLPGEGFFLVYPPASCLHILSCIERFQASVGEGDRRRVRGGAVRSCARDTRREWNLAQRQLSEEEFRMAVIGIKEQLQRTLAYEKVILQFYRELGERLAGSDMGRVCREAAAATQDRVDQLSAWLDCRV
jgi:hypothetical protein